MPTDPASAVTARELRNALAVAHGRLQLTRRRVGNGLDRAGIVEDLDAVIERLYRLAPLIDALEASSRHPEMPVLSDERPTSLP